eukprot:SAG11_NODE_313_length_10878_cov_43.354578_5_plen_145_part_00
MTSNLLRIVQIHTARGDRNVRCGRWVRAPAGHHTRERAFETPFSTPLGEMGSTKLTELQRIQLIENGGILTINTMNMKVRTPPPPPPHACTTRGETVRTMGLQLRKKTFRPCRARAFHTATTTRSTGSSLCGRPTKTTRARAVR